MINFKQYAEDYGKVICEMSADLRDAMEIASENPSEETIIDLIDQMVVDYKALKKEVAIQKAGGGKSITGEQKCKQLDLSTFKVNNADANHIWPWVSVQADIKGKKVDVEISYPQEHDVSKIKQYIMKIDGQPFTQNLSYNAKTGGYPLDKSGSKMSPRASMATGLMDPLRDALNQYEFGTGTQFRKDRSSAATPTVSAEVQQLRDFLKKNNGMSDADIDAALAAMGK